MLIEIQLGQNLLPGIYRLVIILGKDEEELYSAHPFYFELPIFASRTIIPEREYLCPPYSQGDRLKGRFIKGIFMAFCFTNGVPEDNNQIPVAEVKLAFECLLRDHFNTIKCNVNRA